MRSLLLTENPDLATGMALAGIEVERLTGEEKEDKNRFAVALSRKDVGLILLTRSAIACFSDEVEHHRSTQATPLIVTIPESGEKDGTVDLMEAIQSSLGITISEGD